MGKSLVTETPDTLCKKAEMDIMTVDSLLTLPKYPEDQMYDIICFHATQAVEKLLKGYIISICSFPPIKAMREKFSKEYSYEIVGEITTGKKSNTHVSPLA